LLRAGLPERLIVPDAGHLGNLEHPELFTRMLADFVDEVAAHRNGPNRPT